MPKWVMKILASYKTLNEIFVISIHEGLTLGFSGYTIT